jgi:hypothetical protein
MKKIFFLCLIFAALCQSCEPTGTLPEKQSGSLKEEVMKNLNEIPKEFGDLTAVTTHASYEGWSQLWFIDEQQTIRMVRVQFHENRIYEKVLIIPRH